MYDDTSFLSDEIRMVDNDYYSTFTSITYEFQPY